MGNDWQDSHYQDRRRSGDARQRQTPQSSQSGDNGYRQDGWPEARNTTPPRGPVNRSSGAVPPRQTGAPGGSGMLSRARNGGPSGPMPPRERSGRSMDSQVSGPLEPRRARDLPPGKGYHEPTRTSGGPRRISAPPPRSRREGGGLLSFARAASNTMRAIITGRHRAVRAGRSSDMMMEDVPAGFPGEEKPRPRRRYEPYKRSRVRLVIHKRLERRQQRGKKLLVSGIVSAFLMVITVGISFYGGTNVYAFYNDTQKYLGALENPNGFPLTTRIYDRNGVLLYEMYDVPNSDDQNAAYRFYDEYDQIPQILKNATVDIEDKTFWTNSGVDILGILRAGINDVTNSGETQGGSTITQQLIKNAFFVSKETGVAESTPQRKIQEALMAYAVTQKDSKEDLLEFYLNIIPYGYLSRGIEAAAQNMFSIEPKIDPKTGQYITAAMQLDLAQAALLAGLPQNPSGYSPCAGDDNTLADRREAALNRMHDVLNAMLSVNDINQKQWNEADAESDVKDNGENFFKCRAFGKKLAPHFVDYVIEQLALMLNDDPTLDHDAAILNGEEILAHAGLKVYTTLDYRLEQYVEQDTYDHIYKPYYDPSRGLNLPALQDDSGCGNCYNIHDSATVVIDPRDGEILAMNGSGDYDENNHDNYVDPDTGAALSYDPREGGNDNAATAYRQPGSSFKPIVYAAAFEAGWSPATVLQNEWTCFPVGVNAADQSAQARKACGSWYAPANYDFAFLDDSGSNPPTAAPGVRIREALDWSLNIPAVQALYFAGIDNVINLAHRMGLYANPDHDAFSDENKGPAIALGSAELQLVDMVGAYAVFANGGSYIPPRSILLVTDSQGNVVPGGDMRSFTATQVISPQTAFLITNILADNDARVKEFGSINALYFGDAPFAAAKTGTTDDFRDNLTIGYTPYLAVGVWSGNANNEQMHTTIGITGAAPIWHDIIRYAYDNIYHYPTDSYWPVPAGVNKYTVNGFTGLAPYQGTAGNFSDWFNDENVPSVS